MTTEMAKADGAALLEQVVLGGDLSKLSSAQRVSYYREVCRSLQLNPLTKPFSYLNLSGRLVLYANKDCTDQLRKTHGVSIGEPKLTDMGEFISVSVLASDDKGRTDSDIGVVMKTDMGRNIANVMKKAVTQAKRRVTLSICGLGMLDESEIPDVPGAKEVAIDVETGEVLDGGATEILVGGDRVPPTTPAPDKDILIGRAHAGRDKLGMKAADFVALTEKVCGVSRVEDAEIGDLTTLVGELVRQYKGRK